MKRAAYILVNGKKVLMYIINEVDGVCLTRGVKESGGFMVKKSEVLDEPIKLHEKLQFLKDKKGVFLREIAESTELSIPYISDIMRGRTNPSISTVNTLCKYFGITLSEFFSDVTVE